MTAVTGERGPVVRRAWRLAPAVISWGRPGWLLLAGMFLVVGLVLVPVSKWADRARTGHALTA